MQQPQQSSAPGGAPALTVPMLQAPVQATLQGPASQAMAQAYQQVQATPIPAAAGAGIAPVTQHLTTAMQQAPVASTAMQQVAAVAHAPGLGPEPAMQAAVPVQAPMQAAAPAPAPQPAATSPTKKGLLGFFKKDTATAPSPATPQAPAGATPVLQAPANAQPLPAASAPAAPATGMIPDPAAITTQAMMQVTTSPGYPPTGTMQQGIVQMQASVPAVQPTPAAAAADSSPEKGKDKDKGNWWSLGKKKTKEEELPGPSSPAARPPVGTAASPVDIQGAVQAQAQHAMQAQGMVPDPNMQHMQPVQHVQQATVMPPPSGSPPMHGSQGGASARAAAGGALQGQLVPLANQGQQPHHLAQQAQNVQSMAQQAGQLPDASAAASAAAIAAGLVPLQPTLPSYGHAADLPVLQQPSMQQGYANAMNSQGGVLAPNPAPFMQGQGFVPGMNAAGTSMPSVPVVPAPSGHLCSSGPLPPDQLAQMQAKPASPSRFGFLRRAAFPSSKPGTPGSPGGVQAQQQGQQAGSTPGSPGMPGSPAAGMGQQTTPSPGLGPLKGWDPRTPAVDPAFKGPAPLAEKYGPYLRFGDYDAAKRVYRVSVMAVVHQSRSPYPPALKYRDMAMPRSEAILRSPIRLSAYAGYNFWRWDITIEVGPGPRVLQYSIWCSADSQMAKPSLYTFHVPALKAQWHWGFHSCNGFHDHVEEVKAGGIQPLWRDVMHVHSQKPLHVMVGGGDQIYNDEVWSVPSLLNWLAVPSTEARLALLFTQDMVNEVFDFYFRSYVTHFGKDIFKDAMACIPQVMTWDDHDIFDGIGSYPEALERCPVFQGVFFVARKFYLLFQQHATEDSIRELNQGWGQTGMSFTKHLGSSVALISVDTRGERTRDRVARATSWAQAQEQIAELPAGTRHVVVVLPVPIIYPRVPGIERVLLALAGSDVDASKVKNKSGTGTKIYTAFAQPELLDDLLDHWSAKTHEAEKRSLVSMLQDLALARSFRITFMSGDVHVAAVGRFHTHPKVNLKADYRFMPQIVSSAIGNSPPPSAVVRALNSWAGVEETLPGTRERLVTTFNTKSVLKAQRNWCAVHERPLMGGAGGYNASIMAFTTGAKGPTDGALVFELRVEHPVYKETRPEVYDVEVPPLELPPHTYSAGPLGQARPPLPHMLAQAVQMELMQAGYTPQQIAHHMASTNPNATLTPSALAGAPVMPYGQAPPHTLTALYNPHNSGSPRDPYLGQLTRGSNLQYTSLGGAPHGYGSPQGYGLPQHAQSGLQADMSVQAYAQTMGMAGQQQQMQIQQGYGLESDLHAHTQQGQGPQPGEQFGLRADLQGALPQQYLEQQQLAPQGGQSNFGLHAELQQPEGASMASRQSGSGQLQRLQAGGMMQLQPAALQTAHMAHPGMGPLQLMRNSAGGGQLQPQMQAQVQMQPMQSAQGQMLQPPMQVAMQQSLLQAVLQQQQLAPAPAQQQMQYGQAPLQAVPQQLAQAPGQQLQYTQAPPQQQYVQTLGQQQQQQVQAPAQQLQYVQPGQQQQYNSALAQQLQHALVPVQQQQQQYMQAPVQQPRAPSGGGAFGLDQEVAHMSMSVSMQSPLQPLQAPAGQMPMQMQMQATPQMQAPWQMQAHPTQQQVYSNQPQAVAPDGYGYGAAPVAPASQLPPVRYP